MRLLGALGVMVAGACTVGCVPILVPPSRVDVSLGGRLGIHDPTTQDTPVRPPVRRPSTAAPPPPSAGIFRLAAGFSLASIVPPERLLVDASAGYIFNDVGWGERKIHGVYGEFSPVITRQKGWWLYFGGRFEAMFPDSHDVGAGYAFLARMTFETFSFVENSDGTVSASSGGMAVGAAYGTLGIGGFVEAGAQRLPGGQDAALVLGGLSVRFPAAAGVFCCLLPK